MDREIEIEKGNNMVTISFVLSQQEIINAISRIFLSTSSIIMLCQELLLGKDLSRKTRLLRNNQNKKYSSLLQGLYEYIQLELFGSIFIKSGLCYSISKDKKVAIIETLASEFDIDLPTFIVQNTYIFNMSTGMYGDYFYNGNIFLNELKKTSLYQQREKDLREIIPLLVEEINSIIRTEEKAKKLPIDKSKLVKALKLLQDAGVIEDGKVIKRGVLK